MDGGGEMEEEEEEEGGSAAAGGEGSESRPSCLASLGRGEDRGGGGHS